MTHGSTSPADHLAQVLSDVMSRPDIDALKGFVQDDEVKLLQQPSGNDNLLLISTGQIVDLSFFAVGLDTH